LGESNFGGANELQIRKIKLFLKPDKWGFPKSQRALDFDTGKSSKIGIEMVLRIKILALRIKLILPV